MASRGRHVLGRHVPGGTLTTKQPIFIGGMTWEITLTDEHMTIGCQHHALADWWQFDDDANKRMDVRQALAFWKAHKAMLIGICAATGRHAPD